MKRDLWLQLPINHSVIELINKHSTTCLVPMILDNQFDHKPLSTISVLSSMAPRKDILFPSTVLSVCQVFGIFPLSISGHTPTNILLKCVSLVNCLLILCITFFSLYYAPDIFDTTNAIGLFVDILQIMAPILTHLMIVLEAVIRVPSYQRFWSQFERTVLLLHTINGPLTVEIKTLYRRCMWKLGLFFILPLLIEVRILYGIRDNFWVFSRLAAEFSFIGCRLSFLQLCLHIDLINWLMQLSEQEVKRVSNDSRSQLKRVELEMATQVAYKRIQVVQRATRNVGALTAEISNCYRWSLVANLTNNFLSITIAFYWNYRSLYFNNLKYQAGESFPFPSQ